MDDKIFHKWESIDGWLNKVEGERLIELAETSIPGKIIVEIGSWKGKSTVCLAMGSKQGPRNRVYTVDPHQGTATHKAFKVEDSRKELEDNLIKFRVADIVTPVCGYSHAVAQDWAITEIEPLFVSLLFIDGSHEYEDVKRDLLDWLPFLVKGGVVALHDHNPENHPGVVKAVSETLTSDKFGNFALHGTVYSAVKL